MYSQIAELEHERVITANVNRTNKAGPNISECAMIMLPEMNFKRVYLYQFG